MSPVALPLKQLDEPGQVALAALLRLLVRLDGKFSEEEQHALEDVALDFGEKRFWQVMDDVGRRLPDEASIKQAALAVSDAASREAIYASVLHVARSDSIQTREKSLLEWLERSWQLEPR